MIHTLLNLLIILGITVPSFFLAKKLYKKIHYLKNKVLINILSAISAIILYYVIFMLFFLFITRTPKINFDEIVWKNNINERHKMIDDLIQSDYLIGKNIDSIEYVFGKPLKIDNEKKIIEYELIGRTWSDFRIIKLKLFLKNDLVSKFEYIVQK